MFLNNDLQYYNIKIDKILVHSISLAIFIAEIPRNFLDEVNLVIPSSEYDEGCR